MRKNVRKDQLREDVRKNQFGQNLREDQWRERETIQEGQHGDHEMGATIQVQVELVLSPPLAILRDL